MNIYTQRKKFLVFITSAYYQTSKHTKGSLASNQIKPTQLSQVLELAERNRLVGVVRTRSHIQTRRGGMEYLYGCICV